MLFYFVSVKASSQVEDDISSYTNLITSQAHQLQQLQAESELLKSELALRSELTSELQAEVQRWEKKLQRAEGEKLSAIHKRDIALENQKGLTDQVKEDYHW